MIDSTCIRDAYKHHSPQQKQFVTVLFTVVLAFCSLVIAQAHDCNPTLTPSTITHPGDGSLAIQVGGIRAPYPFMLTKSNSNNFILQEDGTRIADSPTFVGLTGGTYKVPIARGSTSTGEVVAEPQSINSTPLPGFDITGVTPVSCATVTATERSLTFSPRYAGLNGQPVSFSVVNEMLPTTSPGPYTLRIYTDNPTITLKATQSGSPGEASFVYNWLADCSLDPPMAANFTSATSCIGTTKYISVTAIATGGTKAPDGSYPSGKLDVAGTIFSFTGFSGPIQTTSIATPGSQPVSFTVTDAAGVTDVETRMVTVGSCPGGARTGVAERVVDDELAVRTYPNPHNGRVFLQITSPVDGTADIDWFTTSGRKVDALKVNVHKGVNEPVGYDVRGNDARLIYRVRAGGRSASGTIISGK